MTTENSTIELSTEILGWLDLYRTTLGQISELEDQAAIARNKIEVAMGESEVATHDGEKVISWRHQPGAFRFDTATAKAALGDAGYKALCVQGQPSRRFVVEKDAK